MSDTTFLVPQSWDAYVGQEKLKERLQVKIDAALDRMDALGHILFAAQPGQGKSTLGRLVADNMGVPYSSMDMPVKWKSLQKVFMEAEMHSVIMLDELHRLPKREQENLLPVLNEGTIQMDNGKRLRLPSRISIFAATTEIQDIIKPLRDRFHFIARFEDYSDEDMAQIVARMAVKVDLSPSEDECMIFGRASASTPRQARNIILTARDLGSTDPDEVLEMAGITRDGLTEDHIEYLLALNQIGGRAGVENLSNMTGQPKDVLVDLEKLLINKGFIIYGAKGRELVMEGMRLVNSLRSK